MRLRAQTTEEVSCPPFNHASSSLGAGNWIWMWADVYMDTPHHQPDGQRPWSRFVEGLNDLHHIRQRVAMVVAPQFRDPSIQPRLYVAETGRARPTLEVTHSYHPAPPLDHLLRLSSAQAMPSDAHSHPPPAPGPARKRASKACQRCSQRKIKCDASCGNKPCSRCRMDRVEHCSFPPSTRGTYDRKRHRMHTSSIPEPGPSSSSRGEDDPMPAPQSTTPTAGVVSAANGPGAAGRRPSLTATSHVTSSPNVESDPSAPSVRQVRTGWDPGTACRPVRKATPDDAAPVSPFPTATDQAQIGQSRKSLASMFEAFLERENDNRDRLAPNISLMYFGESSPLTFALEELNHGSAANLHDLGDGLSGSQPLVKQPRGNHPRHCKQEDIAYLNAKGVFTQPEPELLDQLVNAFVEYFYPVYSIVDKSELLESHRAGTVPWILLHAICFIGATFCDSSVMYGLRETSRLNARRSFYDKAHVLFDVGYETYKLVLLQTTIMLTFWGPQMKSYWNPCSWIDLGVTIAGSLGIHRSTVLAHGNSRERGLVRRLWWAVAVRDAYCATLLGRPFRIRMTQCDAEMLNAEDFPQWAESCDHAVYQIQIAKLSIVLRKINARLFGPDQSPGNVSDLRELLEDWRKQLPPTMQAKISSASTNSAPAAALKLLYHLHNIMIHLGRLGYTSEQPRQNLFDHDPLFAAKTESSAQMIASTAAMLITKRMTNQLPHEVFTGFLLAGIVFYRKLQQRQEYQGSLVAQMARASFDNCQLLLNEVRDSWDPAYWILRIFEFLLSTPGSSNASEGTALQQNANHENPHHDPAAAFEATAHGFQGQIDPVSDLNLTQDDSGFLYSMDWGSRGQDLSGLFDLYPLMSDYFMPSVI